MNPVSVRVRDEHQEFIRKTGFDFATELRAWLDKQRIKHLAGRCAACASPVYIDDGHTFVQPTTPLGQLFEPRLEYAIDLCEDCAEPAYAAVTNQDTEPPELDYLATKPQVHYAAERQALADAQPDSRWAGLIKPTRSDPLFVGALLLWSSQTNHAIKPSDIIEETNPGTLDAIEDTTIGPTLTEESILPIN